MLVRARTLTDLLDAFVRAGLESGRYRNPNQMRSRIRALGPLSRSLSDLEPAHIARFFADFERGPSRRGGPRSKRTVELHQDFLRAALKWGVEQGWIETSPMPALRLVVARGGEDPIEADENRVTSEQVGRLIHDTRIPHVRRALYTLPTHTGCRPGELIELRVGDLKVDNHGRRYWLIARQHQANEHETRGTKTGVVRAVPLAPIVLEAIDLQLSTWWPARWGRAPEACDLVFPSWKFGTPDHHINTSTLSRWLARDLKMLGARRRGFHTLRSTFISRLTVELKEPPLLVEWLTHRTASAPQGGPVVGGYQRGVYEHVREMICERLFYPAANAAQLDFGFR